MTFDDQMTRRLNSPVAVSQWRFRAGECITSPFRFSWAGPVTSPSMTDAEDVPEMTRRGREPLRLERRDVARHRHHGGDRGPTPAAEAGGGRAGASPDAGRIPTEAPAPGEREPVKK